MELKIIETPDEVYELISYLSDKEMISYDCETTGLTKDDSIIGVSICASEDIAYYIIMAKWDTSSQALQSTGVDEQVKELIRAILPKKLVMHNAVFDCFMAEHYFHISMIDSVHTDTMQLAYLLNENRRVGLKELGKEYFGADAADEQAEMKASVQANGGKVTKASYEMFKADPYILAKYGAKDALLTYKLFLRLSQELSAQGLEKFFYEDESMPLLRGPTYQLNTTGLLVDQKAMNVLRATLTSECAEAKAFISAEIHSHVKDKYPGVKKNGKDSFNIGANQQLSWLLFHQMKLEFGTLTDAGRALCKTLGIKLPYTSHQKRQFIKLCLEKSGDTLQPEAVVNGKKVKAKKLKDYWIYMAVDKKVLTKFAPKYKWIEKLLEYNKKMKLLNTYVEGIESHTKYGVVRPSFLQHGTTSGRYASRDPNFQNLPRDDKRIKACIVSRPGCVFVGADYSQLEPRVFAYYSGDKRLLSAFNGTDDFYSVIGMDVFGITDAVPKKEGHPDAFGTKYKKLRDLSKVVALASVYGSTAFQLSNTTGKSVDDTQEIINNYFEQFPGVKDMMNEAHRIVKDTGRVENLFGRPRRLPEGLYIKKYYDQIDHKDLPYEKRNVLNLAVNHRIQSTGASIVNRAAIRFVQDCKDLELKCKLVLQVHDSLIAECKEEDAKTVSILMQAAMENTVELEGIKLEAVPHIGKNLSEI